MQTFLCHFSFQILESPDISQADSRSDQARELRESEVTEEGTECQERQDVGQESRKEKGEVYLSTLKLLLKRGADANTSRMPVPVLFSAILACDKEGIKRLLLLGARTDIPLPPEAGDPMFDFHSRSRNIRLIFARLSWQRRGLYPLHVAAALPGPAGPEITEILLLTAQDPDVRAHDHDEIFELDQVWRQTEWEKLQTWKYDRLKLKRQCLQAFGKEQQSSNQSAQLKEGGRTALHVACQRDGDHQVSTPTTPS